MCMMNSLLDELCAEQGVATAISLYSSRQFLGAQSVYSAEPRYTFGRRSARNAPLRRITLRDRSAALHHLADDYVICAS